MTSTMRPAPRPYSPSSSPGGFTLVELMVVLLIAAVLLCAGVPTFHTYLENRRVRQASDAFFHSVQLTRVLAMRQGMNAGMQPLQGNDWSSGWQVRGGDAVVLEQPALPGITVTHGNNGERIGFTPGGAPQPSGTWILRGASGQPRWHVVINWAGRPRQCHVRENRDRCRAPL